MKKQKPTRTSRRSFFQKGILAGLGTMFGITIVKAASPEEEEMTKMLTADGKLVEVPRKFLPKGSGGVVSNQELFKWREENKK